VLVEDSAGDGERERKRERKRERERETERYGSTRQTGYLLYRSLRLYTGFRIVVSLCLLCYILVCFFFCVGTWVREKRHFVLVYCVYE